MAQIRVHTLAPEHEEWQASGVTRLVDHKEGLAFVIDTELRVVTLVLGPPDLRLLISDLSECIASLMHRLGKAAPEK